MHTQSVMLPSIDEVPTAQITLSLSPLQVGRSSNRSKNLAPHPTASNGRGGSHLQTAGPSSGYPWGSGANICPHVGQKIPPTAPGPVSAKPSFGHMAAGGANPWMAPAVAAVFPSACQTPSDPCSSQNVLVVATPLPTSGFSNSRGIQNPNQGSNSPHICMCKNVQKAPPQPPSAPPQPPSAPPPPTPPPTPQRMLSQPDITTPQPQRVVQYPRGDVSSSIQTSKPPIPSLAPAPTTPISPGASVNHAPSIPNVVGVTSTMAFLSAPTTPTSVPNVSPSPMLTPRPPKAPSSKSKSSGPCLCSITTPNVPKAAAYPSKRPPLARCLFKAQSVGERHHTPALLAAGGGTKLTKELVQAAKGTPKSLKRTPSRTQKSTSKRVPIQQDPQPIERPYLSPTGSHRPLAAAPHARRPRRSNFLAHCPPSAKSPPKLNTAAKQNLKSNSRAYLDSQANAAMITGNRELFLKGSRIGKSPSLITIKSGMILNDETLLDRNITVPSDSLSEGLSLAEEYPLKYRYPSHSAILEPWPECVQVQPFTFVNGAVSSANTWTIPEVTDEIDPDDIEGPSGQILPFSTSQEIQVLAPQNQLPSEDQIGSVGYIPVGIPDPYMERHLSCGISGGYPMHSSPIHLPQAIPDSYNLGQHPAFYQDSPLIPSFPTAFTSQSSYSIPEGLPNYHFATQKPDYPTIPQSSGYGQTRDVGLCVESTCVNAAMAEKNQAKRLKHDNLAMCPYGGRVPAPLPKPDVSVEPATDNPAVCKDGLENGTGTTPKTYPRPNPELQGGKGASTTPQHDRPFSGYSSTTETDSKEHLKHQNLFSSQGGRPKSWQSDNMEVKSNDSIYDTDKHSHKSSHLEVDLPKPPIIFPLTDKMSGNQTVHSAKAAASLVGTDQDDLMTSLSEMEELSPPQDCNMMYHSRSPQLERKISYGSSTERHGSRSDFRQLEEDHKPKSPYSERTPPSNTDIHIAPYTDSSAKNKTHITNDTQYKKERKFPVPEIRNKVSIVVSGSNSKKKTGMKKSALSNNRSLKRRCSELYMSKELLKTPKKADLRTKRSDIRSNVTSRSVSSREGSKISIPNLRNVSEVSLHALGNFECSECGATNFLKYKPSPQHTQHQQINHGDTSSFSFKAKRTAKKNSSRKFVRASVNDCRVYFDKKSEISRQRNGSEKKKLSTTSRYSSRSLHASGSEGKEVKPRENRASDLRRVISRINGPQKKTEDGSIHSKRQVQMGSTVLNNTQVKQQQTTPQEKGKAPLVTCIFAREKSAQTHSRTVPDTQNNSFPNAYPVMCMYGTQQSPWVAVPFVCDEMAHQLAIQYESTCTPPSRDTPTLNALVQEIVKCYSSDMTLSNGLFGNHIKFPKSRGRESDNQAMISEKIFERGAERKEKNLSVFCKNFISVPTIKTKKSPHNMYLKESGNFNIHLSDNKMDEKEIREINSKSFDSKCGDSNLRKSPIQISNECFRAQTNILPERKSSCGDTINIKMKTSNISQEINSMYVNTKISKQGIDLSKDKSTSKSNESFTGVTEKFIVNHSNDSGISRVLFLQNPVLPCPDHFKNCTNTLHGQHSKLVDSTSSQNTCSWYSHHENIMIIPSTCSDKISSNSIPSNNPRMNLKTSQISIPKKDFNGDTNFTSDLTHISNECDSTRRIHACDNERKTHDKVKERQTLCRGKILSSTDGVNNDLYILSIKKENPQSKKVTNNGTQYKKGMSLNEDVKLNQAGHEILRLQEVESSSEFFNILNNSGLKKYNFNNEKRKKSCKGKIKKKPTRNLKKSQILLPPTSTCLYRSRKSCEKFSQISEKSKRYNNIIDASKLVKKESNPKKLLSYKSYENLVDPHTTQQEKISITNHNANVKSSTMLNITEMNDNQRNKYTTTDEYNNKSADTQHHHLVQRSSEYTALNIKLSSEAKVHKLNNFAYSPNNSKLITPLTHENSYSCIDSSSQTSEFLPPTEEHKRKYICRACDTVFTSDRLHPTDENFENEQMIGSKMLTDGTQTSPSRDTLYNGTKNDYISKRLCDHGMVSDKISPFEKNSVNSQLSKLLCNSTQTSEDIDLREEKIKNEYFYELTCERKLEKVTLSAGTNTINNNTNSTVAQETPSRVKNTKIALAANSSIIVKFDDSFWQSKLASNKAKNQREIGTECSFNDNEYSSHDNSKCNETDMIGCLPSSQRGTRLIFPSQSDQTAEKMSIIQQLKTWRNLQVDGHEPQPPYQRTESHATSAQNHPELPKSQVTTKPHIGSKISQRIFQSPRLAELFEISNKQLTTNGCLKTSSNKNVDMSLKQIHKERQADKPSQMKKLHPKDRNTNPGCIRSSCTSLSKVGNRLPPTHRLLINNAHAAEMGKSCTKMMSENCSSLKNRFNPLSEKYASFRDRLLYIRRSSKQQNRPQKFKSTQTVQPKLSSDHMQSLFPEHSQQKETKISENSILKPHYEVNKEMVATVRVPNVSPPAVNKENTNRKVPDHTLHSPTRRSADSETQNNTVTTERENPFTKKLDHLYSGTPKSDNSPILEEDKQLNLQRMPLQIHGKLKPHGKILSKSSYKPLPHLESLNYPQSRKSCKTCSQNIPQRSIKCLCPLKPPQAAQHTQLKSPPIYSSQNSSQSLIHQLSSISSKDDVAASDGEKFASSEYVFSAEHNDPPDMIKESMTPNNERSPNMNRNQSLVRFQVNKPSTPQRSLSTFQSISLQHIGSTQNIELSGTLSDCSQELSQLMPSLQSQISLYSENNSDSSAQLNSMPLVPFNKAHSEYPLNSLRRLMSPDRGARPTQVGLEHCTVLYNQPTVTFDISNQRGNEEEKGYVADDSDDIAAEELALILGNRSDGNMRLKRVRTNSTTIPIGGSSKGETETVWGGMRFTTQTQQMERRCNLQNDESGRVQAPGIATIPEADDGVKSSDSETTRNTSAKINMAHRLAAPPTFGRDVVSNPKSLDLQRRTHNFHAYRLDQPHVQWTFFVHTISPGPWMPNCYHNSSNMVRILNDRSSRESLFPEKLKSISLDFQTHKSNIKTGRKTIFEENNVQLKGTFPYLSFMKVTNAMQLKDVEYNRTKTNATNKCMYPILFSKNIYNSRSTFAGNITLLMSEGNKWITLLLFRIDFEPTLTHPGNV